jgi:predicted dehydrogenase
MAIQALNAGCHVFIEKPLSVNMDGVSDLKVLSEKYRQESNDRPLHTVS